MKRTIRETLETIVVAMLIALVLRAFMVGSYVVEGTSMEPSLLDNERLLVNKLLYRFSPPKYGDIVVFRYPRSPDQDYVKRIIALPGETVEIRMGRVYVEGVLLSEPYVRIGRASFPAMIVPSRHVFVLGDNRGDSNDSRAFGPVAYDLIKGRVFAVFWPLGRLKTLSVIPG